LRPASARSLNGIADLTTAGQRYGDVAEASAWHIQ